MNRIDTETGYIYLGDVVITPDKKIADYKEYEKAGLVRFINEGNGDALIDVNGSTDSNGIDAHVTISIYEIEIEKLIFITVTPMNITTERIIASKKWIAGMINESIEENADSFSKEYSWGHISVAYGYDPHYGAKTGGEALINYK